MKYIFGPVNSRRLGLSLGIDLLPHKICNFNCIYCEVGPIAKFTCDRQEYAPTADILAEIDRFLAGPESIDSIDYFTITATGEPTLHTGIGTIIRHIKHNSSKPVAVLTNGSLLHLADVREELMAADLVIPSLDSARQESYRAINRPAKCAPLDEIINGLIEFRRTFTKKIWLEILLAKDINDSADDITALTKTVTQINPDRIQLNTVARPPLEAFATPISQDEMNRIAKQFDRPVEIIVDFEKRKREGFRPIIETELLQMLQRRPCTAADASEALNLDPDQTGAFLKDLEGAGKIIHRIHNDRKYYQIKTK